ncbi:MAG: 4-(cytidine 5'-diphospho)-2-C-methyl-D-erythritol kinase [Spirochaetaceae bacterium]|nr:4-(cytidine 5'-diphospho)-2-C-methyl-D-erythritol kinase [Spirochaetaceae bacterium]
MPGRTCRLDAPAKINLHLEVEDRRADGYHNLISIFLAVSFGDTLVIEENGAGGTTAITMERETGLSGGDDLAALPPEKNLVFRAVELFREKTRYNRDLAIRLIKRVPAGGGLGGGSSDAAAVLRALNVLAGAGYGRDDLAALSACLGSDVPFFMYGGAALVTGRGEIMRPLDVPAPLCFVMVTPRFGSSTARAFALLDAARGRAGGNAGYGDAGYGDGPRAHHGDYLARALGAEPSSWPFYNDFLPVLAGEQDGIYPRMMGELHAAGAAFTGLSGSGSSCFGVFPPGTAARRAAARLKKHGFFVQTTIFLASMPDPMLQ